MSKVLAIAGMHRSGTSLTANWLYNCGLHLGDNLMNGAFGNIKGHFEDWEIVNIHENDLKEKGLYTTGLRLKNESVFVLNNNTKKVLKDYIKRKEKVKEWGWKEPRGTLYLDSWKELLPGMKCIAVYRHYGDVIDSLRRRIHHSIFKTKIYRKTNRTILKIIYPLYIYIEIKNYANS